MGPIKKFISTKEAAKLKDLSGYPFMNLSLADMPGEEWKDMPGFDGYYLVSNYGRIWAKPRPVESYNGKQFYYTKEMIRKQSVMGAYNSHAKDYSFQLNINLRYGKDYFHLSVNRLVYEVFIGPVDYEKDKLRVVHKDGDGFNNRMDNLMLCNGSELYYGIMKSNRRPANKAANTINRKVVHQYSLGGKKLNTYTSVAAAAAAIGSHRSSLRLVLNKRQIQLKGFVYRFEGDVYQGEHANASREKEVLQFAPEGRLLKRYPSVKTAASATGIDADIISRCARQKIRFAGGFV